MFGFFQISILHIDSTDFLNSSQSIYLSEKQLFSVLPRPSHTKSIRNPQVRLCFMKHHEENFRTGLKREMKRTEHGLYCSSPWFLSCLHEHHPDSMTAHVALFPTMESHKINNCWLPNLFHTQCDFVLYFNLHSSVWTPQRQILRVAVVNERKIFHPLLRRWNQPYVQQRSKTHCLCNKTTHTVLTYIYVSPGGNSNVEISSKNCLYLIGMPKHACWVL